MRCVDVKWGPAVGPGKRNVLKALQAVSFVSVALVVCYLSALALRPGINRHMPVAVRWLGEPG
jgi:hypothetical protein